MFLKWKQFSNNNLTQFGLLDDGGGDQAGVDIPIFANKEQRCDDS